MRGFLKAAALLGLTAFAVSRPAATNPNHISDIEGPNGYGRVSFQPNALGGATSALDTEFAKLEDVKAQMAVLHAVRRKQEQAIMEMLRQDFAHCEGIQCMVQTAMQKAPDFAHLIAEHFSHDTVKLKKNRHSDEIAFVESLGSLKLTTSVQDVKPHEENSALPTPPSQHRPHPPFQGDPSHPPYEDGFPRLPPWAAEHPHPPFHGENPPPHHKGPPPPPEHYGEHPPPHNGEHPPPPPPPPHHDDGLHGPPGHHHGPPPFFRHIRHHRFRILKAVMALIAASFLMSLLLRFIRNNVTCFNNPRRRADRAYRREERRNRCQYRRAAHRHRIQSWWAAHDPRRRTSAAGTADYDEKRALILQQEGILERAMQNEIRNLETDAAELEEGRGRSHNASFTPQELDGGIGSSRNTRPQSYASTEYSAPPPRYEEELDDEMIPVDGFMYTPSNTDDTSESSFVDFSPRMSCDTSQTNTTKSSTRED